MTLDTALTLMVLPQKIPSVFRYFTASLKPFGRFLFWGPPSLILLAILCYWQYRNHPEWLAGVLEPATETSANRSDTVDLSKEETEALLGNLDRANQSFLLNPKDQNFSSLPLGDLNLNNSGKKGSKSKNPTSAANPLQGTQDKQKLPSLFPPLMPNLKDAQTSAASASQPTNSLLPSPEQNSLLNSPSTSTAQNSLQKAIANTLSIPRTTGSDRASTPTSGIPSFGQPAAIQVPSQSSPLPYYTYGGQVTPIQPSTQSSQAPYYNYGGQITPIQPPTQSPQSAPYYGYGGQGYTQPYTSPQPYRAYQAPSYSYGGQSYAQPYPVPSYSYGNSLSPLPPTQVNQPNSSPATRTNSQVQPPMNYYSGF